ncbi:hypothetical protein JW906_08585 [bacterium]|nr:hypothetical protein [bacterium]
MKEKDVDIFQFVKMMYRWRRFILINLIIVAMLAAGASLVIPELYVSRVTLLPPVEDAGDIGGGISSFLGQLPFEGMGLNLGLLSEEASLFIAVIKSRTVMESVAEKFQLTERYKADNMEETVRKLRKFVDVDAGEDGTLTLRVGAKTSFFTNARKRDEARSLSRDMATFFIQELDRVNKGLKTERARNARIFIEKRYMENRRDLEAAENVFKQFQKKYGAISLPDQTTATLSTLAELKAQIIAKEFELGIMENYRGSSGSEVMKVKSEVAELSRQYDKFVVGKGMSGEGRRDKEDIFLPLADIPDLGVKYARLLREVLFQEKIMEFILPQFEQAKIQEARDTPTVQVLDEANYPIKREKPKRKLIVLFSGLASLILCAGFIAVTENWNRLRDRLSD